MFLLISIGFGFECVTGIAISARLSIRSQHEVIKPHSMPSIPSRSHTTKPLCLECGQMADVSSAPPEFVVKSENGGGKLLGADSHAEQSHAARAAISSACTIAGLAQQPNSWSGR